MITTDSIKRYQAAKERFFKPALINFFATEFPRHYGPIMRENISDEIIRLFEAMNPESQRLLPGQLLWNALDKATRGDSPNRKFVPVILTLIDDNDVEQLANGEKMSVITQNSIARMISEAYEQGGIMSMRDVGLLTLRSTSAVSHIRINYETENKIILPHTGNLHDMGSCITHKKLIVRKVILEKKDPADVARETKHSQRAVDKYLNDFNRIKSLYKLNKDIDYMHLVTGIAKHVVKQYLELLDELNKNV